MELLLLCLKIFFFRIIDVSLATFRTIVIVKGRALLASLIGFVETTIWFLIVREALLYAGSDNNIFVALAYAGGFASGTFLGGILAKKFINVNLTVQVVTSSKDDDMLEEIRAAGYAITVLDINNSRFGKKKYMLFCEIMNSQLNNFKSLIYSLDKRAFVMVQETKYVYNSFQKK